MNRKVHAALRHGLRPFVCVGEQSEDKRRGVGRETVRNQVRTIFAEVEASRASHLIVAYGPVWAIGADGADIGMDYVREVQNHIRATLEEMPGPSAFEWIP